MATNQQNNNSSYMTMSGTVAVKRIRTPSNTDVLLGRGGGINNHIGNRVFRDWVRERKDDYNLAASKAEKTRVAKEVMDRVHRQSPPGRFLQKDPSAGSTGGWWVEVDELRALSKTSQALREGAPQIRAAHQGKPPVTRKRKNTSTTSTSPSKPGLSHSSRAKPAVPMLDSTTVPNPSSPTRTRPSSSLPSGKEEALNELNRHLLEAKAQTSPQHSPALPSFARPLMSNQEFKRQRLDLGETPPLLSVPHHQEEKDDMPVFSLDTTTTTTTTTIEPPLPMMPPKNEHFSRAHSLALSDISAWGNSNDPFDWQDDFVNPFLDESDVVGPLTTDTSSQVKGGSYSHPGAPAPAAAAAFDSPKNMVRNVSSDEDRDNYGQIGEMYAFSPNHDHDNHYDDDDDGYDGYNHHYHNQSYSSIRDFNEEMKLMMDDVHPEEDLTYPSKELRTGTENSLSPTLLLPWRGGTLQRRYGSNGTVKSNSNHSSSHRSLSIGDMLNERQ
eukprot:CAMPEP_0170206150 /NCGR_PEP_ID=MMETSP0116_2-20130129/2626_1 /TAXON_ID=400756 /ORGANISM="Durinskia baltica, Strain CSIRO CS-38" /LENGTH=496 /DNA_ID=CAMNT_0010456555 /DNA_START=288 /DNA_END=1778 /DNA_ORIENTATION=-